MASCQSTEVICWIVAAVVLTLLLCLGCGELFGGRGRPSREGGVGARFSKGDDTQTKAERKRDIPSASGKAANDIFADLFSVHNQEDFDTNRGVGFTGSWKQSMEGATVREETESESELMQNYMWSPGGDDDTQKNIQQMQSPDLKKATRAANTSAFEATQIRSPDGLSARVKGLDPMQFARPAVKVTINQKPVSFLDSEARQNIVMGMTNCSLEQGPDDDLENGCSFTECR